MIEIIFETTRYIIRIILLSVVTEGIIMFLVVGIAVSGNQETSGNAQRQDRRIVLMNMQPVPVDQIKRIRQYFFRLRGGRIGIHISVGHRQFGCEASPDIETPQVGSRQLPRLLQVESRIELVKPLVDTFLFPVFPRKATAIVSLARYAGRNTSAGQASSTG